MRQRKSRPTRGLALDWIYLVGIVLKGLDAVFQLVAGIPLLLITHVQLMDFVHTVTAGELVEDPHDFLANLSLNEAAHISAAGMLMGAIYLAIHGAAKLAIVIALVRGSKRAHPWAVGVLAALLVAQIVDLVVRFSIGVLLLSIVDAIIIALLVREWRHHRSFPDILGARVPWIARHRHEILIAPHHTSQQA
jgi:uncharacterized membrane protein